MPLDKALGVAEERGVDLVEVAPMAVPPVCRLLDYGKFRYEQSKRDRKTRKKASELHQVRLRPKIDEHDMEFKVRTIKRFLGEGHKVRISVRFRGREQAHPELGRNLLERVFQALQGAARAEAPAAVEGRDMVVTLVPARSTRQPTPRTAEPVAEAC